MMIEPDEETFRSLDALTPIRFFKIRMSEFFQEQDKRPPMTDRPLFQDVALPPRKPKGEDSAYYTCAFCMGEEKMEVSHGKGLYYCHKCQRGGKLTLGGSNVPREQRAEPEWTASRTDTEMDLWNLSLYRPITSSTDFRMRYLLETRKLSSDAIELLAPHIGPEFDRVYFSVYHSRHTTLSQEDLVTFIGRSVFPEHTPKYKHPSKEVLKRAGGKSFWGFHRLEGSDIVLVEGVFDACHAPNRLAIMGSSLTESQIGVLLDLCPGSVTVMLDGDALKQSAKVLSQLIEKGFQNVYLVRLPYGEDPDSLRNTTEWEDKKEQIT
jgi:hypothetical protein